MKKPNFIKTDNILFRLFWLSVPLLFVFYSILLSDTGVLYRYDASESLHFLVQISLFSLPVILLGLGFRFRAVEKKVQNLWSILRLTQQVSIPEIIHNTGMGKQEILTGVRLINNSGSGYFIHDPDADTITDGRLSTKTFTIKNCPSCGSTISKTVPLSISDAPVCEYCDSPIDISYINDLKLKAIDSIRRDDKEELAKHQGKINWIVFGLLFFFFWPGAILYLYIKLRRRGISVR